MAKKGKAGAKGVSQAVVVYNGSIRSHQKSGVVDDACIVNLSYSTAGIGSSVGLQFAVATNSVTTCGDWAGYVSLYDEFRVLGYQVDWLPNAGSGSTQYVQSAGLRTSTHNPTNPGPFTSLGTQAQYADWEYFNTGERSTTRWKMCSTEEAQFLSTSGTPGAAGWINVFAPYATSTSTAYGVVLVTYAVQFRGRK